MTTVDEPLELVRRWLSAFNARDEDALRLPVRPRVARAARPDRLGVRRPGHTERYGVIATFTTPSRWFENSS